jgi:aminopeptidase N
VETAATGAPEEPGLRLPGDLRPTKYSLELTLIPDQPTAHGKLHVDARVMRPTRVVWMHAEGLSIAKAQLGGVTARVVPGGNGMIGLHADRELAKGSIAIDIAYSAPIDRERSRGIYSEQEGSERYAYTFFEPIDARRAFPVFDEPAYKCPWQLTFHIKQDHVALGNAPVVRESDERDGMKRVELAPTKPLPSYLIAFVVGPFELVDGGVAGRAKTPIRFIIPKGRAGELGWAKQVTPRVVAALESYFDMAYPFGKLDVAVVPRFWGTMEHPGIVAMGQPLTLIRPDQETRARRESYANILAHELAHYWFGDLVTMVWWDDTWLNEALGQWMDLIITDAVEPDWRILDRRVGMATDAMNADETLSAQAMRQAVTTNEGIAASFDGALVYAKGATMFRMFEAFVGETAWRDFIRAYIRAHLWGNASATDLMKLARDKLGAGVEAGLRSFIEQPGAPKITAKIACGAKPKIALSQTRSLPADVTDPVARTWKVPVCVRYGDAKTAVTKCVQLEGAQGELESELATCPTWIITNANANGYYRSAVDPAMTKALLTPASAIAKTAKPTPAERMMLVADLRAAADRGELGVEQVLALVPVIAADPDDRVARYAFEAASFRADALDDALYGKTRRFFLKSFGPRARQLGWTKELFDTDARHDLRRAFVPVVANLDPVLGKQAEALADTWLANKSGIADDLVGPVLAVATSRGGLPRYEQLLAASKQARDRSELQRLIGALGGFRDPALVTRALELVRSKDIDLRDSLSIVYRVMFQRETRRLGFEFVQRNIDELLARMRDDEASWFLGALAGSSCEPAGRAAVAELIVKRAENYDGAQAVVKRGLEQSDQCIASLQRQLPALRKFLARF